MTAIIKRSKKLYSQLDANQLAALAFNNLTNGNFDEVQTISQAVPQYTYRATDLDYKEKLMKFERFYFSFAVEFWQVAAKKQAAKFLDNSSKTTRLLYNEENKETAQVIIDATADAFELVAKAEARQAALVSVAKQACQEHGLDLAGFNFIGGVSAKMLEVSEASAAPSPEWVEQYLAMFNEVLR